MKLLCVGDSHSRLIGLKPEGARFRYGHLSPTRIPAFDEAHILSIKGATAAGFQPKDNMSSSFARATRAIRRLDPDVICFGFGQVDAEQSCYYMALRDGTSIEAALDAKTKVLTRYLRFCLRAAKGRHLVIKGLNTSTLHNTADLHRMLLRKIPRQLGLPRKRAARWLMAHGVDIEAHRHLNTAMADALRTATEVAGLPYFDLRDLTALPDKSGLTRPALCGNAGDVHLAQTPDIETAFGSALARSVRMPERLQPA